MVYIPNWASTYLTISCKDTDEGKAALADFAKKVETAIDSEKNETERFNSDTWEVDIEKVCLGSDDKIDFHKRGYIVDFQYDDTTIYLTLDEAWAANIAFWQALLYSMYGDKLSFTFTCDEPGMGLHYTNDPYQIGVCNVEVETTDLNVIQNIPGAWVDSGNPLFKELNSNNPFVNVSPSRYRGFPGYNGGIIGPIGQPLSYDLHLLDSPEHIKEDLEVYYFNKPMTEYTLEECVTHMRDMEDKVETNDWFVGYDQYEESTIENEVTNEFLSMVAIKNYKATGEEDVKNYDSNLINKEIEKYKEMTGVELNMDLLKETAILK